MQEGWRKYAPCIFLSVFFGHIAKRYAPTWVPLTHTHTCTHTPPTCTPAYTLLHTHEPSMQERGLGTTRKRRLYRYPDYGRKKFTHAHTHLERTTTPTPSPNPGPMRKSAPALQTLPMQQQRPGAMVHSSCRSSLGIGHQQMRTGQPLCPSIQLIGGVAPLPPPFSQPDTGLQALYTGGPPRTSTKDPRHFIWHLAAVRFPLQSTVLSLSAGSISDQICRASQQLPADACQCPLYKRTAWRSPAAAAPAPVAAIGGPKSTHPLPRSYPGRPPKSTLALAGCPLQHTARNGGGV